MKKGQVQGAIAAVISLIVGVGISVLILIFVGVLGGQAYNIAESNINEIGNNVITNEAGITANATTQLAHHDIQEGTLAIFNTTTPQHQWALSNFTINYEGGTILSLPVGANGSVPINSTDLSANYTWGSAEIRNSVRNSIVSGFEALENTGEYLPLIVLGIVIFIVLGLVLGMTAFTGAGGAGGTGSSAL